MKVLKTAFLAVPLVGVVVYAVMLLLSAFDPPPMARPPGMDETSTTPTPYEYLCRRRGADTVVPRGPAQHQRWTGRMVFTVGEETVAQDAELLLGGAHRVDHQPAALEVLGAHRVEVVVVPFPR